MKRYRFFIAVLICMSGHLYGQHVVNFIIPECPLASSKTLSFQEDLFDVFPNPASDKITVSLNSSFSEGQLSIYDALGKQVFVKKWESAWRHTIEIDISQLSGGLYVMRFKNAGILSQKQFLIQ